MAQKTGPPDRAAVERLLGGWRIAFGSPEILAERQLGAAIVQDLSFPSSTGEAVPATFTRPIGAEGPLPAVLYCHAHGGRYDIGRAELTEGRPMMQSPYLDDLTGLGSAVLCLEMAPFGARAGVGESALAKARLWQGKCLFGQMLAELRAGIDWLAALPEIDPQRIATLGLSMGATQSWWLAALDPRIRCAVQICSFADLGMMVESGAHDGHGPYMTVPGLLALTSTGRLAGLAAPRPQLVCTGLKDALTPEPAYRRARAELESAYAEVGAPEALHFLVEPELGHEESLAMRAATLDFLRRHLGRGRAGRGSKAG